MYQVNQAKKNGFKLVKPHDIQRFVGSLQDPKQNNNIFLNQQFFIPNEANARNGYVAYAVQINKQDVSDLSRFKSFLKIIGAEAFFKTVVNLAKNTDVQRLAEDSFEISDKFKRLEIYDQRLSEALGKT